MELVHALLLGTWEYFTHFLDIFHHFIITLKIRLSLILTYKLFLDK